jgi:signal transduction histidine kinase
MNKGKGRGRTWLTILPKLMISFLTIAFIPLLVLGYLGYMNLKEAGRQAVDGVEKMGERDLKSAKSIGDRAIEDSVYALDHKSTEAIEVRTVELAARIADFLYERDADVLMLAAMTPDPERYLKIYRSKSRDVVVRGPTSSADAIKESPDANLIWENPENRMFWRHRTPYNFQTESRRLYKEITFVNLDGMEVFKIADDKISQDLRDISSRENTYCRAEDYHSHLSQLAEGEVYVSNVIGAHVKGWIYKSPEGIKVKSESAYAGKENPGGKRFEGIVRWATPVFKAGERIGYVTIALDHTHIMEFTDHVVPTDERMSAISDGGSGNYAFLWDYRDRSISHPRDFFICGYDPETGEEVPGWISAQRYQEYLKSGMSLEDFVRQLPSFKDFTQRKKGAKEQIKAGQISLDCRILDTAPQCQGWHRGTEDGGSGSFVILWSGIWKFTSYAAVPYYTGIYGKSKRGFGYVTIGANVEDFHKAANSTKQYIESAIREKGAAIRATTENTRATIEANEKRNRDLLTIVAVLSAVAIVGASIMVSLSITRPIKRLTEGAVAISQGRLEQHIEVRSQDEISRLATSFNEMAAAVAELDRMKSEFVATASHELRTPIHSMLLAISGILGGYSGEINDEVREDLQMVEQEISRLTRLVNDLLDLARIESRKIELNFVDTSLSTIVDTAVEQVSGIARSLGHSLRTVVPPDLPSVWVDRDRIVQVIINLLSNSIKYNPPGGSILVEARRSGTVVIVSIADNGYGIPSWAQKKIFDKFFQADSIMSHRVGGSGLGLTISKEIVELHGGTISCTSPLPGDRFPDLPRENERQGTVVDITLHTKAITNGAGL